MKLEMTKEESEILIQLLDISVKAGGLAVAEAGVVFCKRIKEAQQEKSE